MKLIDLDNTEYQLLKVIMTELGRLRTHSRRRENEECAEAAKDLLDSVRDWFHMNTCCEEDCGEHGRPYEVAEQPWSGLYYCRNCAQKAHEQFVQSLEEEIDQRQNPKRWIA